MAKQQMIRKISGVGMAGVLLFGASAAMAGDFTATASVQNALAVTNVANMDLGTIFATESSSSDAAFFTLTPAGDISGQTPATSGFQLLSLSAPTPAQASVTVGSQSPFTVTLPAAETLSAPAAGSSTSMAPDNKPVYLCAGGACTNTAVPRLELVNFRLGQITNGSLPADATVSASNVESVTPSFGVTEVGFNVGATVVTDTDLDTDRTNTTYEPTTYTGNFKVTASY